jgi:hypothetical protein
VTAMQLRHLWRHFWEPRGGYNLRGCRRSSFVDYMFSSLGSIVHLNLWSSVRWFYSWKGFLTPSSVARVRAVGKGNIKKPEPQPSTLACPNPHMTLHSWRPLVHITHIECIWSSRSKIQYICSLPLSNKQLTGIFFSKWNHQ